MSDRKYQYAYVVTRRNLKDNSSIPCAVFGEQDMQEAHDTADAYNQKFKDDGHDEEFVFEVHITALYD